MPSCRSCAASKTRTSITSRALSIPFAISKPSSPNWCSRIWSRRKNAATKVPRRLNGATKSRWPRLKILDLLVPHLNAGKSAVTVTLTPEQKNIAKGFFLLTDKPTIFAANVKEGDLATADSNAHVAKVREYARTHIACETVVISAQIESDLVDLSPGEAREFLQALGVEESGVGALIRSTYHLLGLRTYFTAGEKEVRAWTIHAGDTAPKAAGVIHSDFERGFIKAETVAYDDLVQCGSVPAAREKGLYRVEGKEYVVQDGDVMLFKFNV